ncbi:MAG: hypothetical protein WBN52_11860, partial [Eudoraea sp.]|uniref:hypothetical protein n=1 Tax=Eudoraea sp. TaxID=1979955 RepID=UPI003C75FAAE
RKTTASDEKTNGNKTYKQYGLRPYSLGLRTFMKSAKSLGFCFLVGQRKKQNQKIFAMSVRES